MGTKRFDLVTLTLLFDLLIKNCNLGYNIWMASTTKGFDISRECSLWQDFSMGTNRFDLVALTLVFDLLVENFNLVIFFDW
jgi:hypothetical protein